MDIIKLNSVDSTNAYLKREYNNLDDFSVVYSLNQKNGKGRNTHVWKSEPNKNLLCSILIKNEKIISKGSILSLISGVAVSKTLRKLHLKNVYLKWPNDVYVENKKISGILLESKSNNNKIECVIIGVGINLNQTNFDYRYNATSYKLITKKEIEIDKVLALFIKELKSALKTNPIPYINKYNYLKNKTVKVTINNKKTNVVVLSITNTGHLKVKRNNKIYLISSNEVNVI